MICSKCCHKQVSHFLIEKEKMCPPGYYQFVNILMAAHALEHIMYGYMIYTYIYIYTYIHTYIYIYIYIPVRHIVQQQTVYYFLMIYQSMYVFFWPPFFFFFLRLLYLSIRFLFQHKSRNWTPDIYVNNAISKVLFPFCCIYSFLSSFLFGLDSSKTTPP